MKTILLLFILILPLSLYSQGWYIPSGYQNISEASGDNILFKSNNYYLFGITYGDHIALGQNGGTPYNISESNFRSVISGSGQIVICEAIPNSSSALISYASNSSSPVSFNSVSVSGNSGAQVQFSATTSSGTFTTDNPDFYQGTSVESWFNSVSAPGSTATYKFNIPSGTTSGSYSFYIKVKLSSNSAYFVQLTISVSTTGVTTNDKSVPLEFRLDQNYPNPFNPSTTISFSLQSKNFVSLKVFDITGKEVTTLLNETMSSGVHTRLWNANDMPSGIYFYRLQAGVFIETKKLILLK